VSVTHAPWLDAVVSRATQNVADGGGPFAALVVRGDDIVAEGVNRVTRDLDPTAHAEVVAIRSACQAVGDFSLAGCVLVSSCEPCPLCLAASLWARVDEIVYAADRHDAARGGFDDLAFYDLFDTPRDKWALPVHKVDTPSASAPFDAWLAKPDRVDY
jgi:guanine deaminase